MSFDCSFLADLSLDGTATVDPDLDTRRSYAVDYGTDSGEQLYPDAVVVPESTADVSSVLSGANDRGIPVTAYAAGTSTEGNPVPVEGGISLDLTAMAGVYEIRPDDFQVDVGPGTVGIDLEEAAAEHDLFFPPFPQSRDISTIGGMIANDASGTKTVKYGEVGDWVLELEIVRADGTVQTVGGRAAKSSSGYNMRDLIVGSEGTLAVITEATLELATVPAETRAGRAVFDSVDDAAEAVSRVIREGVDVATLELIDPATATISNRYTGADLPDSPMTFVEFHGGTAAVEAEVGRWRALMEDAGAVEVAHSADDEEMRSLWRARREIGHALKEYDPDLTPLAIGDVTVPISRYPEILQYARSVADELDLLIPCFGHAGDGNLHYAIMVDPDDEDHVARGEEASDRIIERAIELDGTCTGEHGVGRGKRRYILEEHGPAGVESMRMVKDALDPNGILNPGKVFPER